jgi:hypothetical protein
LNIVSATAEDYRDVILNFLEQAVAGGLKAK